MADLVVAKVDPVHVSRAAKTANLTEENIGAGRGIKRCRVSEDGLIVTWVWLAGNPRAGQRCHDLNGEGIPARNFAKNHFLRKAWSLPLVRIRIRIFVAPSAWGMNEI